MIKGALWAARAWRPLAAAWLGLAWLGLAVSPADAGRGGVAEETVGGFVLGEHSREGDAAVAGALREVWEASAAHAAAGPEASARGLTREGRAGMPSVSLAYPAFGVAAVDEDIRLWAESIAATFERELTANSGGSEDVENYQLTCTYDVSRPSPDAVSVAFDIWTYTGGAHGNLDIITLNYSLITGQRLTLVDLFEDVDKALAIMSVTSREVLMRRLGGGVGEQMILDGTEPEADNFSSLSLEPGGVRIHFQPYQVAPWSAGAQSVTMTLDQLAPARPFRRLWHR